MLELIKEYEDRHEKVNWDYFYDLMFTKENLKLVHPACQINRTHEKNIDESKVLRKKSLGSHTKTIRRS